ncbi:MAG: peptidase MA family metallohydrolase [Nannocystaceae bacterium]
MTFAWTLLRRLRVFLLAMALAVVLPIGAAQAEWGEPAGWEVENATSEVIIGRVVLRYDPSLHDEAMVLAQAIPEWWSEIEQAMAGDLDDRLTITYVNHAGRIAEATGMPRWAAGVAHPPTGEIMIARHAPDGSLSDLDTLTRHELAHVALHRATNGAPLPRWFHEGVAESFADRVDLLRMQSLAAAIFGVGVPPLAELEGSFRGAPEEVTVAYAAARDLVNHLRYRDADGSDIRQLFTQLRLGHGFDASVLSAYGVTLDELEVEWRTGLAGRFSWFPMISSGGLPFFLVAPLMTVAFLRRRRQIRAGWDRLEREDEERFGRVVYPGLALRGDACHGAC